MNLSEVTFEVERLLYAYAHALDDEKYEEWPDFFTDGALYKIIARDNFERNLPLATLFCDGKAMMRDRVIAIRRASVFPRSFLRHLISAVRVLGQEEGRYWVQSNYVVFSTLDNQETKVFNAGKYLDEVVFVDGRAKFQKKTVIYDTLQIPGLLVIPI